MLANRFNLRPSAILLAAFLISGMACTPTSPPDLPSDTLDQILELNSYKLRAEHAALKLARVSERNPQAVDEAARLYNDARVQWNAWLATLQLAISTGQNVERWNRHRAAAEEAATTSEQFLARAEEIPEEETLEAAPVALATTFVQIGVELWKGWQAVGVARRKLVSDALEGQKWPLFEQIVGIRPATA